MALSNKRLQEILEQIRNDRTLAQSLLDEGLDRFVAMEPLLSNEVLKTLLLSDLESVETTDVMTIMAVAKSTRTGSS